MGNFRKKHMTYSYGYDKIRYKVSPASECVINPQEAERLKKLNLSHSIMVDIAMENNTITAEETMLVHFKKVSHKDCFHPLIRFDYHMG
jgi:hypothetical protein